MFSKLLVTTFAVAMFALVGFAEAQDKDKKRATGSVVGVLKDRKDAPKGPNVFVEIQADGEEKARKYRVAYDPKIKAPIADVLKAVKETPIGSRVQIDWIEGEGYNITNFKVLKKAEKN